MISGQHQVVHRGRHRKQDEYRGPGSDLAMNFHRSAGLAREPVGHAEPQTAALADLSGREEGLDGVAQNVVGHADPGIPDGNLSLGRGGTGISPSHRNRDGATRRHRFTGVVDDGDDGIRHPGFIDDDFDGSRSGNGRYFDFRVTRHR